VTPEVIARPSPWRRFAALATAELWVAARSPRVVLWASAFPLLILLLGEAELPPLSAAARGTATWEIAVYAVTIGVFALALFGYAPTASNRRASGLLARLACTPTPPWVPPATLLLAEGSLLAVQTAIVLAAATVVYGARGMGLHAGAVGVALVCSLLEALALGYAVAEWTESPAETLAVARILLVALFLLGGAFGLVAHGPPWLRTLAADSPEGLAQRVLLDGVLGRPETGRLLGVVGWTLGLGLVGSGHGLWRRP
jgi:ABC-2 type transport system permease protein